MKIPVFLKRRTYYSEKDADSLCIVRMKVRVKADTDISLFVSAKIFVVSWGDGVRDEDMEHYYEKEGVYEITIAGREINELNLVKCNIFELDLSECGWLEFLNCSFNNIERLDVSDCPWLSTLDCSHNSLNRLILGQHLRLNYLDVSSNCLKTADLAGCTELLYFYCNANRLASLSFIYNTRIWCVDCGVNKLTETELNNLFESLPVYTKDVYAKIMCDLNCGYAGCNLDILKEKGWRWG